MFDTPVLLYSSLCPHCNVLMSSLEKNKELYDTITKVNIDVNPQTKKRHPMFYEIPKIINKQITEVPTLIVNNYFLVGTDVVSWLQTVLSKQAPQQRAKQTTKINEPQGFNPFEMSASSDGYSTFGDTSNSPNKQSYQFVNDIQETITTIAEDEFVDNRAQDLSRDGREQFENMTRKQHQQAFGSMPNGNVNDAYNGKGVTRQDIQHEKKMSFDALLEQRMLDRQNI